jgi:RNA polymerase sigma factor for flagellar operon FliA
MTRQEKANMLWEKYYIARRTKDPYGLKKCRGDLVVHYLPLVDHIAKRLHTRITEVDADELFSMGITGLFGCIDNYNQSYKNKFETYATYRIKGSMLDHVRKQDWVPRMVRKEAADFEQKKSQLESEKGMKMSVWDLAESMDKPLEEIEKLQKRSNIKNTFHFAENQEDSSVFYIEDVKAQNPQENIIRKEVFTKLMGKGFTPQERKIIWMYYYEKKNMGDIAEEINISETRISQMHKKILKRLSEKIKRNPLYFEDILSEVSAYKKYVS